MASQGATGYSKELRDAANAHKTLMVAARKLIKDLHGEGDSLKKLALSIIPVIQGNKSLTQEFLKQSTVISTITKTIKKMNLSEQEKVMILKQVIRGVKDSLSAQKELQKQEERATQTKDKLNTKIQVFKDKLVEAGLPLKNITMHLGQFDQFAKLAGAAANGDARAMAALSRETTRLINSQKKATKVVKKTTRSIKLQEKAGKGLINNLRNAKGTTGIFSTSLATMRGNLLLASFAMRQTLQPLLSLGAAAIEAASNFEIYKIQLEVVLGSQEKAQQRFEKFKEVAQTTPFNIDEVMQSGVILERFGQNSDDLIKTMADLAVFMNMSMPEATSAFGRALAGGVHASKIFRNRALFNLIKTFNEIQVLPKDLDKFKDLMISTFQDTEAGIAGVTDKMSETIKVQFSNLEDRWIVVLASMGDAMKNFNQLLINFAQSFIDTKEAVMATGIVAVLAALAIAVKLVAVAVGTAIGFWVAMAAAFVTGLVIVQKLIKGFLTWKNSTEELGNELTKTDDIIQQAIIRGKIYEAQQKENKKLAFEQAEATQKLNEEIEENSEKYRVEIRLLEAVNIFEREAIKLKRDLMPEEIALIALRERKIQQLEEEIELDKLYNESLQTIKSTFNDLAIEQLRLTMLESQGLKPSKESMEIAQKLNERFDDRVELLNKINTLVGSDLSAPINFNMGNSQTEAMKEFATNILDVGFSFESLKNTYDDTEITKIFSAQAFEGMGKTSAQAETMALSFRVLFQELIAGAEVADEIKALFEALVPGEGGGPEEVMIPGLGKASEVIAGIQAVMDISSSFRSIVMSGIEKERNAEIQKAKDTITNERKLKQKMKEINDDFDAKRQASGKKMKALMIGEAIASGALAAIKVFSDKGIEGPLRWLQFAAVGAVTAASVAQINAQKFAKGGDFVTSGPQMIMVGDNPGGKERVQVTPLSSPNFEGPQGGGNISINFTGNVMSQDFIEDEAIPMIKEAIRRGADIGVA